LCYSLLKKCDSAARPIVVTIRF